MQHANERLFDMIITMTMVVTRAVSIVVVMVYRMIRICTLAL